MYWENGTYIRDAMDVVGVVLIGSGVQGGQIRMISVSIL